MLIVSWLGVKLHDGAESLRQSQTATMQARWVSAMLALTFMVEFWFVEGPRGLSISVTISNLTKEQKTYCFKNQLHS
jgi:hypothetical protein